MNCKNCGHPIEGNFCSNCGQKTNVDRITLSNFLGEVSETVFQINRGFFYTLKELSIRPGHSLNEFLEGKRKNHFKPMAYVLTLSTLYFIIAQLTNQNTVLQEIISGWMQGVSEKDSVEQTPAIISWLSKNYAYTTLLLLPVFSLSSYLSFKRFGKNYLEHVVINAYITGQQAVIYSIFTLIGFVLEYEIIEAISFFSAIIYSIWSLVQFFSEGNTVVNILRTILTYFLYSIFSTALLIGIMGIGEFLKG